MIIGISGKKQHGKDTVANIIQYLVFDKRYPGNSHTLQSFSENTNGWKDLESTWKRKQFAGKLKQVVALLIGCTIEQLEDSKFKETPLEEEWRVWYWAYKQHLAKHGQRFGKLFINEEEATENSLHNFYFKDIAEIKSEILTPRKLLQLVGTEAGRDILHPNVWVNALMADYKGRLSDGSEYRWELLKDGKFISNKSPEYPNWIITDVRFTNEVKAIEDRGGIVIRVNRPNPDQTCQCGAWWFLGPKDSGKERCPKCGTYRYASILHLEDTHPSETSLDNFKFKYTIINNGSIEELIDNVRTILLNLKLL